MHPRDGRLETQKAEARPPLPVVPDNTKAQLRFGGVAGQDRIRPS